MGISEPFHGVVLSGKSDIQKFDRQIKDSKPTNAAIATVSRGEKMVSEYQKKGCVTFSGRGIKKDK